MTSENLQFTARMGDRISPFIERTMRQKQITGLSMALVDEDKTVFAKGYGFADTQAKQSATSNTLFRIGSITKLFTATAAMQLYEKGLLDIDRPVFETIPQFSIKNHGIDLSQITPRTLMTHHSGLPGDWYTDYWSDDPHAFRKVVDYLAESHLAYPPNTVFSYSNLGMSLLGVMMEQVSGLSYQQLIEQNILAPLGMAETRTSAENDPRLSYSKAFVRGKEVLEPHLRDAPAGTILSSVQDMSRFIAMVLGGGTYQGVTILQSKTLAEMFRPQNEAVKYDLGFRIGLNWILNRPELAYAGKVCWHDGGSPHFFSMLMVLPELGLGAVVLTNSDGGMGIVAKITEEVLKEAIDVKTGKSAANASASVVQRPPAKKEIENFGEKTFASVAGIVRIKQQNGSLRAFMKGQQFLLSPEDDGWYSLRLLLFGILPIKIAALERLRLLVRVIDGVRVLGLEQEGLQVPIGFEYYPTPIPEPWTKALGMYRLAVPGFLPPFTVIHLEMTDGKLMLRTIARKVGKLSLVLRPISETESTILGLGRFGGEVVERIDQNGIQKLRMFGLELEKQ